MTNKRIIRALIVVSALFLALLTYLLYFNMFQAETVATNPYNRRQWDDERYVTRGTIYDSTGLVLAETVEDSEGNTKREYPEGRLYSHVIGYCSKVYGKSLLERAYDSELLGKGDIDIFQGDKKKGFDLNLTINNTVQKHAYSQMRGRRGALVAMNPQTGEVIAMVSLPDFDPNAENLEKSWGDIVEDENSPLISRTIQGLYPPGSTYKTVTLAAAFENGISEKVFDDIGSFTIGDVTVENYNSKAYGEISLERAFSVSSNQVFCNVGYDLGSDAVLEIAQRFGVDKELSFDLEIAKSRIEYKKMTDTDGALVSIGQGQLLTTPMHMAMICSAVANGGELIQPYLVDSVTKNNTVLQKGKTKVLGRVISEECAAYVGEQMVNAVKSGTGTKARISGVAVAGKTGTAENEKEKDHSWFIGYAPAEDPKIAVAVILENDGRSGGDTAAPIAGSVISKYLSTIK
ncbi:MAG: penicillin-binding transpeptidase domain-containing protein [Clostridia bacterium]|nr:penicillin-binding transpeptidase domain-containing protein [Clostridia bacterium]